MGNWNKGRSWVETRAAFASALDTPGYDPACCELISYDEAMDRFGAYKPSPALGWDPAPSHAGYVKRCPAHDTAPTPRTWILDIPLCRFKNFLKHDAGGAFPLFLLNRLLPDNHPKYEAPRG